MMPQGDINLGQISFSRWNRRSYLKHSRSGTDKEKNASWYSSSVGHETAVWKNPHTFSSWGHFTLSYVAKARKDNGFTDTHDRITFSVHYIAAVQWYIPPSAELFSNAIKTRSLTSNGNFVLSRGGEFLFKFGRTSAFSHFAASWQDEAAPT